MRRPSGPAIAVIVLVVAFVLLSAYVLSIGPAWRLAAEELLPDEALLVYWPLGAVAERVPFLEHALYWYIGACLANWHPPLPGSPVLDPSA